jgi:maltose O-acetyltransferase
MSLRQYLGNALIGVLPPTRAYALKRLLLRRMGVNAGRNVRVASSVRVYGDLQLSVGNDTFLGHDVLIAGGRSRVMIGDCVDIAPRVSILTGTHKMDMLGPHSAGAGCSRDIVIEDGVWIGAGSTILGGVTIGRKAVIAAGSTVTHDIPPYTLAAGAPCRPKKVWRHETGEWTAAEAKAA